MWPFKKNRSTEDAIKAFSSFVPEEKLKTIMESSEKARPAEREVSFILIDIRGEYPKEVFSRMSRVLEDEITRNLVIESVMSSFVFGTVPAGAQEMKNLGLKLREAGGEDIRILYGKALCLRGLLGLPGAGSFGTVVPRFSEALKVLILSEFGTLTELH